MGDRLSFEMQRLYGLPGQQPAQEAGLLRLVGDSGEVRAMVMSLSQPADWAVLSAVWRGVQTDLELPAPAIAINGVDAFELWFSLVEPVPLVQAVAFLHGLRRRYLTGVKPQRVHLRPDGSVDKATHQTPIVPARQGDAELWSAFVAPDLAAVFGDEPVLDVAPGGDAQAELLSRLLSIKPDAFEAALEQLDATATAPATALAAPADRLKSQGLAGVGIDADRYTDPKLFLLDVMNDASVALALRIEAAKALIQR